MLVNYFCGLADRLKSLARLAQSAGPVGSKRSPGWLKALARQAQVASLTDSKHWPDRLKALTRQAQITSSSEPVASPFAPTF